MFSCTRDDPLRGSSLPPFGGVGSLPQRGSEPSLANSGAIRSDGRKNPTEDASPAPGGTGLRTQTRPARGGGRARNWVVFGPRPARGGGGQIRPNSERLNCVPHGAIYANINSRIVRSAPSLFASTSFSNFKIYSINSHIFKSDFQKQDFL